MRAARRAITTLRFLSRCFGYIAVVRVAKRANGCLRLFGLGRLRGAVAIRSLGKKAVISYARKYERLKEFHSAYFAIVEHGQHQVPAVDGIIVQYTGFQGAELDYTVGQCAHAELAVPIVVQVVKSVIKIVKQSAHSGVIAHPGQQPIAAIGFIAHGK